MAADPDPCSQRLQTASRRAAPALLLALAVAGASGPGAASASTKPEAGGVATADQRARERWRDGARLHLEGRYAEAIAAFRESIAARPTPEGHTYLGWSLAALGRLEEAIVECRRAIELDPDYGNPYNDIGAYLIRLGRPGEAIPWLERAIEAPRYCCRHFSHANLGRALLHLGRARAARRAFVRALQHRPNYPPALRALEYLDKRGLRGL